MNEGLVADPVERTARGERGLMNGSRCLLAAVGVLALVLAAGAVAGAAWWENGRRSGSDRVEIAGRAADRAQALRASDPALAAQVAVAAHELADTARTRSALLNSTGPYVTRLRSSGAEIRAVAYSHDRAVLATGSGDGVIELWDATSPRRRTPLGRLPRGGGPVGVLAFRPSGGDRVLLAAGPSGVELWNAVDPARPHRAAALPGAPAAAFTPDGRTVLVAAGGGIGRWRAAGVPAELPLVRTPSPVTGFAVAADTVATAHADGTVRLWDPDVLAGTTGRVSPAATIATGVPGAVLALSPDGRTLAYSAPARGTWLCRLRERRCGPPTRYGDQQETVHGLAFSPDGGTLATGGSGRRVRLWDVATGRETGSFGQPGRVLGLAFTADGQALAAGSTKGAFYQWHRPTRVHDAATGVVLSRDRTLMVTTGPRGGALWDVRAPWRRILLARWRVPPASRPAISGDARSLATIQPGTAVTVWDLRDRREPAPRTRVPLRGLATAALSEDGDTLATGDAAGRLLLWDVARPGPPRRLAGRDGFGAVAALDFSPDGRLLASGGADRVVRLWDVRRRTLDEVGRHDEHTEAVTGVRFGPKGLLLASTGHDWLARVWTVADPTRTAASTRTAGQARTVLAGHAGAVRTAAFSPDGTSLATTDAARATRLWDLRTGRLIAELTHPDLRTALYADAHTLLSAAGHDVRLWDLRPGAVAARVCATAGEPVSRSEWRRFFGDLAYRPPCQEAAAR